MESYNKMLHNTSEGGASQQQIETQDALLKNFSLAQREYIVTKLYPIIRKTLVHFVTEAKNNN